MRVSADGNARKVYSLFCSVPMGSVVSPNPGRPGAMSPERVRVHLGDQSASGSQAWCYQLNTRN